MEQKDLVRRPSGKNLVIRRKIQKEINNNTIKIIELSGFIDDQTLYILKEEIGELYLQKIKYLILVLHEVWYINSYGISYLLEATNEARKNRGDIKLIGINDRIMDLFISFDVHKIFNIYKNENDAMSTIKSINDATSR